MISKILPQSEDHGSGESAIALPRPFSEMVMLTILLRDYISRACGKPLYTYNREVSRAIIEAVLRARGDEIIILQARQTGKTETAIQTMLALGIVFITEIKLDFHVGIFTPAQSQAIQVTRDRFRQMFDQLRPIFDKMGLKAELDAGRTTSTYVIKSAKTGKECKIRALSADATANIKAETLNMILTEQTEDIDDEKLKTDIFPMAAAVGGVRVLTGTATAGIRNRYFHDRVLLPSDSIKFTIDYKTAMECNPKYREFVEKEKKRLGEDSIEFRTQFALEWVVDRLRFVEDREEFLGLAENYPFPIPWQEGVQRTSGWDPARSMDMSVVTILEGITETRIVDWWYSQGTNLEEQAYVVGEFLKANHVSKLAVDSVGLGQGVCDILENHFRGDFKLERAPMDVNAQDLRFKLLDSEIKTKRLHYPAMESRAKNMFLQQMLDAERKYQGSKLMVASPDEAGIHDDFVDSLALALWSHKQKPFKAGFVLAP